MGNLLSTINKMQLLNVSLKAHLYTTQVSVGIKRNEIFCDCYHNCRTGLIKFANYITNRCRSHNNFTAYGCLIKLKVEYLQVIELEQLKYGNT